MPEVHLNIISINTSILLFKKKIDKKGIRFPKFIETVRVEKKKEDKSSQKTYSFWQRKRAL
jgi:hypothetical protein